MCNRINKDRFGDLCLLYIDSVETIRSQRLEFTEPVVEKSCPEPNYHFRWLRTVSRARRPRHCKPRREVVLAVRVGLRLVTQAITECQIRLDAPVVLYIHTLISLANISKRVSSVDAKRRGTTTSCTNFRRRLSLIL